MKMIALQPEDFKKIVDYLAGVSVPFGNSDKAAEVLAAIKRAKDVEIEDKN